MTLANQPDAMPSNKMIALAAITIISYHFGGSFVPPEIMEAYGVFISVTLALISAYLVPDRSNVARKSGG